MKEQTLREETEAWARQRLAVSMCRELGGKREVRVEKNRLSMVPFRLQMLYEKHDAAQVSLD